MEAIKTTEEFKTIGEAGPAYEVLDVVQDSVKIRILITGEIVEDYPIEEYKNDPSAD